MVIWMGRGGGGEGGVGVGNMDGVKTMKGR